MKNVLLLSWKNSNNNGTNLQAYALYAVANRFQHVDLLYGDPRFKAFELFKVLIQKRRANKGKVEVLEDKKYNIERVFDGLNKAVITGPISRHKVIKSHDLFLVGSDQLWNPFFLDDSYLLTFVRGKNKARFSYGTSIGVNNIPTNLKKKYHKCLSKFNKITMREKTSANVLSNLLKRDVERVTDPVLLLTKEEWIAFAIDSNIKTKYPDKYILCYFVGNEKNQWEEAKERAKETGLPIVCIPMNKWDMESDTTLINECGPKEFTHLIMNASYVYTDSLHALMMSFIFNKKVELFERFINKNRTLIDTRIADFLSIFDLEDTSKLDYIEINRLIKRERERSLKILEEMLKD